MAKNKRSEDGEPKLKPFQKKLAKKGHKSMKNVPELESEKKKNQSFSITPTGRKLLNAIAESAGCSASTLLEDIARGRQILIPLKNLAKSKEHLELKGLAINYNLIKDKPELSEDKE